jgi:hypothetical protein
VSVSASIAARGANARTAGALKVFCHWQPGPAECTEPDTRSICIRSKAQVPRTVNVHGRDERESLRERETERQRERKREREREREKFIENLEVTEGR